MTPTPLTSGATVPVPDSTIRVEAKWDWAAPGTPTVDLTWLLLGADGRVGGDGDMLPPGPPVLVLFLSDGGVSRGQQIESIVRKSADRPMFWQFVGVDGADYGVLERLDRLTGRRVDNAGFFAVDDIDGLTDADLYGRLLSEFPTWVRAATHAGVIR